MITRLVWENIAADGTDAVWGELRAILGVPDAKDKADICTTICSQLSADELEHINLFDDGEETAAGTHGRIAYVRNKRNDDAFLSFSEIVRVAKASYMPSFSDACEAVFDNRCEFCILPVENNTDGKLYSFYSMMDRYDLKICHKVEISSEDGSESIGFALVGRSVNKSLRKGARMRFEFSVVREGADFISEVLGVADALGGRISSIGTQPVLYDDKSCRCYFAIDFLGQSPVPMALYMNLEYPGYTPLGLYKI